MPYPKGFQLTEGEKRKLAEAIEREMKSDATEPVKFEIETETVTDQAFFEEGTWTNSRGETHTYTAGELDEVVKNAAELDGKLIPFIRVDHTDEKTHKRITGRFKIGDIANIRHIGKRLIGDFVRMPKKAAELLRAGLLGRPSAEFVPGFKDESTGKEYGRVLWGTAVLPAKHPAVTSLPMNTLDGIYDLCFGSTASIPDSYEFTTANEAELFEEVEVVEDTTKGGTEVTQEEIQRQIDEAVAKARAEQKAEFEADKKALNDKLAAFEQKQAEEAAAKFERDYTELVDKGKKDGKILPAQEAGLKKMVDAWKATTPDTAIAEFAAYVDGLPVVVVTHEAGAQGDPKEKAKGGEVKVSLPQDLERYAKKNGYEIDAESAEKDAKVRDVMKRNKGMNYSQALNEVEQITVTVVEPTEPSEKVKE
jgi:hypothetical protein